MHKNTTHKLQSKTLCAISIILLSLSLFGCNSSDSASGAPGSSSLAESATSGTKSANTSSDSSNLQASDKTETDTSSADTPGDHDSTEKGSRDNTPQCLVPSADGTSVDGNELVSIDLSHIDCGYFMAQYLGTNNKVKMQVTGPNDVTYTYNLGTSFEVFPFAAGNGTYMIAVHENIAGTQYATIFSNTIDVTIADDFSPYLYPNQYVDFNSDSEVVALAAELAYPANDDLTVVTNVYNYIISNVAYDYDKASTVESGYIPVVDELLSTKKGICFDFASTMAAMLRSQRIPTRLEIGYAGEAYHAWISTYLNEEGWVNGIIEFDGQSWKLMDPTFAVSSTEEDLKDFIGDGTNYVTKYIY